MICAYSILGQKCLGCTKYFSAYLAFLIEFLQLIHIIFILIMAIASGNYSGGSPNEVHSAFVMFIVSFVFNAIHNVVTMLISGYRGDSEADVLLLKQLLCCYKCCPNCGRCWDTIMSVFNCFCIIECFDCYIFTSFYSLVVEASIQFVSSILMFVFANTAYGKISNVEGDDMVHTLSSLFSIFTVFFFCFTVFNAFFNMICIIHQFVNICKKPVHNFSEASEKEDQVSEEENDNNNDVEPSQPNQNQDNNLTFSVAIKINKEENQFEISDPENLNNDKKQNLNNVNDL
ncbi:hypothetical protein M9Y10_005100 [Tritrichomonas musculus]|uniref:Transmembrane protein n=1 Tax=Tritrichomonas musculus TaxID=1915356 RepID=A0ABR2JLN8_9EUKA